MEEEKMVEIPLDKLLSLPEPVPDFVKKLVGGRGEMKDPERRKELVKIPETKCRIIKAH